MGFYDKKNLQLVILLCAVVLCYANTLDNEFVWDDNHFLVEWNLIKTWNYVPELLMGALPTDHQGVYRPVRSMVYLVSYSLFGENPFWYHLQALAIFSCIVWLLFKVIPQMGFDTKTSFWATLLFAVHPIHTEAISFITASFDMIGIIFMLASLHYFLKRHTRRNILLSHMWATLAFFTYEITLTLPFFFVLLDWYKGRLTKDNWSTVWQKYVSYVLIAVVLLVLRSRFITLVRGYYLGDSIWISMLFMCIILSRYIQLLLVPFNLTVAHRIVPGVYSNFHDYNVVDATTLFDPVFFIAFILTVILGILAIRGVQRKEKVGFYLTWFAISILPVANVIPQSTRLSERYIFLASIVACLAIVQGIRFIFENKKYYAVAMVGIVLLFGILTIERNNDWQDSITLWESAVMATPANSMLLNNLGTEYYIRGMFAEAEITLKRAIALNPGEALGMNNLGVLYRDANMDEEAFIYFMAAYEIEPTNRYALSNIANHYSMTGEYEEAIQWFTKTIELYPYDDTVHSDLGWVYYLVGDLERAQFHTRRALEIVPNKELTMNNLKIIEEQIAALP